MPSDDVKMVRLETRKGLFEAVRKVSSAEFACVTMNAVCNVWHERLGHCGNELLCASIPHTCGVKVKDLAETIDCKPCVIGKDTRTPKRALAYEDRKAAKSFERVFQISLASCTMSQLASCVIL